MKLLSQEVVLALLRVKGTKEPNLVFLDWSTYIDTSVDFGKPIRSRTHKRKLIGLTYKTLRGEIAKRITVEFITTTLSDDVEDTTRAASIFCTEGTGLDVYFLHKC